MIEETKYYLGTLTYSLGIIDTPKEAYANERAVEWCDGGVGPAENTGYSGYYLTFESTPNCRVWANNQATWTGKVSLMYPSDYGFSVNNENNNWDKQLKDFSTIQSSSWLNSANHSYEELLSPTSDGSTYVAIWGASGVVDATSVYSYNYNGVRPSVNLISEIKIRQGDGTSESPYFLEF